MSCACARRASRGADAELWRGAGETQWILLRCCFCMNLCYLPLALTYFKKKKKMDSGSLGYFLACSGLVVCTSLATYSERGALKCCMCLSYVC